jgi:hypothetical protein
MTESFSSTESQAHGFILQDLLFTEIYGATREELRAISYTAKLDLPGELNRLDPGVAISCKVTCNANRVDMADCLRIYDEITGECDSYHMLVAIYAQDDTAKTKQITELVEVDLLGAIEALFGAVTRAEIAELDAAIKAVPRGRAPTPTEKTAIYALRDSLHAKIGALQLAPKMDSKGQRRLQCSFNRFQDFLASHTHRVIARGPPSAFRDHALSIDTIESARRVRHPRIPVPPE